MTKEYGFLDLEWWEPGKGGLTPSYDFEVDGTTLRLHYWSDDIDEQDKATTHEEALDLIDERLQSLKQQVEALTAFRDAARSTTRYEIITDGEEDDDLQRGDDT